MRSVSIKLAKMQGMTLAEAYGFMKHCGFDGIDAGINCCFSSSEIRGGTPFLQISEEAELLDFVRPFGEAARKTGMEHVQAHAPFPIWTGNRETDRRLPELIRWYIHGADAIGCHRLVVHPVRAFRAAPLPPEACEEKTMEFFSALIPAAREYGVTVCAENLCAMSAPAGIQRIRAATCSDPDQVCRILDGLNSLAGQECFGFCLDTGHLLLTGLSPEDVLPRLGTRLKALHLHDNDGVHDRHLPPYMGCMDWDGLLRALAASPFEGALNFEIGGIWDIFPPELWEASLRWSAACGKNFAKKIEEMRSSL